MASLEELKAELKKREQPKPQKVEDIPIEALQAEIAQRERGNLNILPDELLGVKIPTLKETGKAITESLPAAGAAVGGGLGALAGVPTGGTASVPMGLAGAGLGAAAGQAAKGALQTYFFPDDAPKGAVESVTRVASEGLKGVAFEGAGQLAAKPLQAATRQVFPKAKKGIESIEDAAKRLGVKLKKGMTTESKIVQNLDSSLEQSPTLFGAKARSARNKIEDVMQRRLEKIAGSTGGGLTKYEAGEAAKAGVLKKATEKIAQARSIYKSLDDTFADQPVSPNLIDRFRQEVKQIDAVRLNPRSPAARVAKEISEASKNIKTVSDLKKFRTLVGKRYEKNMDDATTDVIDSIYGQLTDLRNKSLTLDPDAAKQIVEADKIWREFLDGYKVIDDSLGGRASRSPEQFLMKLEKMDGSDIPKKLFQAQKVGQLKRLKAEQPQVFNQLKQDRMNDILSASQVKGELNARKFIRNIEKLPEETKIMLYGDDGVQIINDVKTLADAFPDKIGPSGTPEGIDYLSTVSLFKHLRDGLRQIQLSGMPTGKSQAEKEKILKAVRDLTRLTAQEANTATESIPTGVDSMKRRMKGR